MNKQEALEALLVKMREWEQTGAEVPARNPEWVLRQMNIMSQRLAEGQVPMNEALVFIGAAAVYLLRDEVEVVDAPEPEVEENTGPTPIYTLPSSYQPAPINGAPIYGSGWRRA